MSAKTLYTDFFFSGSSICNSLSPSPLVLHESVARRTVSSWMVWSKWVLTQRLSRTAGKLLMKQLDLLAVLKKILKEYWWESSSSLEITFHPKMIPPTPSSPYQSSASWHLSLFCSTALLLSFSLTSKVKHPSIHCEQDFPAPTTEQYIPNMSTLAEFIHERWERRKCFLTQVQPGLWQHNGY